MIFIPCFFFKLLGYCDCCYFIDRVLNQSSHESTDEIEVEWQTNLFDNALHSSSLALFSHFVLQVTGVASWDSSLDKLAWIDVYEGCVIHMLWLVVAGCGWLWLVVAGCGWLWLVVAGCGWLWLVFKMFCQ